MGLRPSIAVPILCLASLALASGQQPRESTSKGSSHPVPVRVAAAVMASNLISKVDPVGPNPCDMCGRIGGTIVLRALISKSGRIEKLSVLSGPDMFKRPVLTAVRQWSYRPFLLNGKPVEVLTTIAVPFEWPPPPKP
jgi:TonB family protein